VPRRGYIEKRGEFIIKKEELLKIIPSTLINNQKIAGGMVCRWWFSFESTTVSNESGAK